MNNFLLIILIIMLIIIINSKREKREIIEKLELENRTTIEWTDPNEECLKNDHDNCELNNDCVWNNHLNNCVNKKILKSEINLENICNIYNNDYLDSEPYHKKKYCQNSGCNIINISNGKTKCVSKIYNNHLEYCQDNFEKEKCVKTNECIWKDNNCIPDELNSNIFCKNFNTNEFLINNLCKKDINRNNYNCYVEIQRDDNNVIIPYTGLGEFKKRKCEEGGCKTINITDSNHNLCVSNEFKNEEEVCLNYYNGEKVSFTKCNEIGCNYYPNLNKGSNGICYSKQVSDKFDNQVSSTIICNSITNPTLCNNIGCIFTDNKCKN